MKMTLVTTTNNQHHQSIAIICTQHHQRLSIYSLLPVTINRGMMTRPIMHRSNRIGTNRTSLNRNIGIKVSDTALTRLNLNLNQFSFFTETQRRNHSNNSHGGHHGNIDTKGFRPPQTFKNDPYNTISPQMLNQKTIENQWRTAPTTSSSPPPSSSQSSTHSNHSHHTHHSHPHAHAHVSHVDTSATQSDADPFTGNNVDLSSAQRKKLPAWLR